MAYTAFQWSDIRARLKDRVELKPFWSDDEYLDAMNEALSAWNLFTGYWRRRETITTVANQYEYVLSASMVYQTRLTFNSLPLSPSARQDFNNARYTWRSETTTSGDDVPTRPTMWAPISLMRFLIWPADAVGGNTLTADGVSTTPILAHDDDTLDVSEGVLTVLLGYAQHALAFKKGGPSFQATQVLFQNFLTAAAEENDQLKTTNAFRRAMGLEWRDLKPLHGKETLLDAVANRVPPEA